MLEAIHANATSQDAAEQAVFAALPRCEHADALDRALALDPSDDLPIALKWAMFERRLELGPREPALLRRFAEHLWLHGPERDAEAEALRREADALDAKR